MTANSILIRRGLKGVLRAIPEVVVAAILLEYSLKLFILLCFVYFIYRFVYWHEAHMSLIRHYQLETNETLALITHKLGVSQADSELVAVSRNFDDLRLSEREYAARLDDRIVAERKL